MPHPNRSNPNGIKINPQGHRLIESLSSILCRPPRLARARSNKRSDSKLVMIAPERLPKPAPR